MGAVYGPYEVNKKRIGNKSLKFTKRAMVFNIQRKSEKRRKKIINGGLLQASHFWVFKNALIFNAMDDTFSNSICRKLMFRIELKCTGCNFCPKYLGRKFAYPVYLHPHICL